MYYLLKFYIAWFDRKEAESIAEFFFLEIDLDIALLHDPHFSRKGISHLAFCIFAQREVDLHNTCYSTPVNRVLRSVVMVSIERRRKAERIRTDIHIH